MSEAPLPVWRHKVSSVLNKSSEFASKHMFDGDDVTCWNSAAGSPQFVQLEFETDVIPTRNEGCFQGGFVGQDGAIEIGSSADSLAQIDIWDTLEDNNSPQSLSFNAEGQACRVLKVTFPASTDFYGRITIYKLQVFGRQANQ